ncbi:MAG TPA: LamG domain-containing protein [Thermoanaerobaculia bacterium]|nr:LamG domain-containing protein [Thermoanaerobaculia bacterium]
MLRRTLSSLTFACLLTLLLPVPVAGQPFGTPAGYLAVHGGDSFVEVPSSPALNPGGQITIELWTALFNVGGCRALIGKGYLTGYAVGFCNGTVRSYLEGAASVRDGGVIDGAAEFHHIAVTYDGSARRHYIDGELVAVFAETGSLPGNSQALRILGDVDAPGSSPLDAYIFEVRLWNVARTQAQIRQTIGQEISTATTGLVAEWHLRGDTDDAVGGHHGGTPQGTAQLRQLGVGVCFTNGDFACLHGRFLISTAFQVLSPPQADGHRTLVSVGRGHVVPGAGVGSALFWFFGADNWELLVKHLNACPVNSRFWVYSAATTDQHYALLALDTATGTIKQYLNYAGPPAPAVTDSSAFATCP